MMTVLLLCCLILQFFQYWELKKHCRFVQGKLRNFSEKTPPKARGSFVVKRLEERIKEALYE